MAAKQVNDSLNALRGRWGLPLPVILLLCAVVGCFLCFGSFPNGEMWALLIGIGIPTVSACLVAIDPAIYKLATLSMSRSAGYDPGKKGAKRDVGS